MNESQPAAKRKGNFANRVQALLFGTEPKLEPGWRYEWKFAISPGDFIQIRDRLRRIAEPDAHAAQSGGTYRVRSLYFDDFCDSALMEKVDGVNPRGKFRIRMYNGSPKFLRLERKFRDGMRGIKYGAPFELAWTKELLENRMDWMEERIRGFEERQNVKTPRNVADELILALYYQMRLRVLRPRAVVEYAREPYAYAPGNVRVTFDSDLRGSDNPADFLWEDWILPVPPLPANDAPLLMEVKWDSFLPAAIQDAIGFSVQLPAAFSKYAQYRLCN